MPNDAVQFQGEGDDHVADYLDKLKKRVPYYVRQDTLTKQTAIVFPMRRTANPGTVSVYTEADGYREFTEAVAQERFAKHPLNLRVSLVEGAIKVPGDTPLYRKVRSEAH